MSHQCSSHLSSTIYISIEFFDIKEDFEISVFEISRVDNIYQRIEFCFRDRVIFCDNQKNIPSRCNCYVNVCVWPNKKTRVVQVTLASLIFYSPILNFFSPVWSNCSSEKENERQGMHFKGFFSLK